MRGMRISAGLIAAIAMCGLGGSAFAADDSKVTLTLRNSYQTPFPQAHTGFASNAKLGSHRISPAGRKPAGLIRRQIAARRRHDEGR